MNMKQETSIFHDLESISGRCFMQRFLLRNIFGTKEHVCVALARLFHR